ncbi:hypothetical protein CSA08_02095 [Candidatus Gracilibacteria bacterium]|nr:MAG: hypothetical protein CSA08_02095 [Candidatus Gracilibacteria bacterium]
MFLKSRYIAIPIGFFLVTVVFSLYANYDNEKTSIGMKESISNEVLTKIIKQKEKKEEKKSKPVKIIKKNKNSDIIIKKIKFTSNSNKRFLNLTKKSRVKLKEKGISLFISLPKSLYYCNKFGCYLNYKTLSKSDKKYFVIKKVDSKTGEKKSIVYLINYNIKDKGYDISKKLKVTSIQDKSLSCESSSAADIISYLINKEVGEDEIIEKIKIKGNWFSKLPIDEKFSGKVYWGDPDVGFVGHIDDYEEEVEDKKDDIDEINFESELTGLTNLGLFESGFGNGIKTETEKVKVRQYNMNGYGVHEKPLISVYFSYGLKAEIINKFDYKRLGLNPKSHLKNLLLELKKGNMVQLWGDYCTLEKYEDGTIAEEDVREKEKAIENMKGSAKNTCSNTSGDRELKWYIKENGKDRLFTGLSGEHNFYLLGYTGDINHPTGIIVWDTYTGKHIYPPIEWYRKWGKMQNRSIIISKK